MAAAVLVGLTAFAVGRWSVAPPAPPGDSSAVALHPQQALPSGEVPLHLPAAAEAPRPAEEGMTDSEASPAATGSPEVSPTPVTYVGLLLPGSDAAIEVPIYRASESLAEWQPFEQPVLSPEEAEALRKAGYHVEWQRELLTLTSTGGEPILLPLESVRVEPSRY